LGFSINHPLFQKVSTTMASAWKRLRNCKPARRKLRLSSASCPDEAGGSGIDCLDPKPAQIFSSWVILRKFQYLDASFLHLQNEDHNDISTSQGCCKNITRQIL